MGRASEARIAALIREHSPHRTVTELGRAIGHDDLSQRLRYARRTRSLPRTELVDAIAEQLDDVGRAFLIDTLAWDARLPGFESGEDADLRRIVQLTLSLDRRQLEAWIELLGPPAATAARRIQP